MTVFQHSENMKEDESFKHFPPESADFDYTHLDADKVLSAYGKYGRYQMLAYFTTMSSTTLYAMAMLIVPFLMEQPDFDCIVPDENKYTVVDHCTVMNSNNKTMQCSSVPQNSFNYSNVDASLVAEFNLVCDRSGSAEHAASFFILGGIISPFMTQLSDLHGRKLIFLLPLYLGILANLACSIAPNYFTFLAFRFIAGGCLSAGISCAWVLCLESVSIEFRSVMPLLANIMWVCGYMTAGVFKLFISNWRWLYFAVSVPGLLTIPYIWLIQESLHFSVIQRRNLDIKRYINRASCFNNKKIDLQACLADNTSETPEVIKRTICDILKKPSLLCCMLINAYIVIVMSLSYWALSLFSVDLSEDKMTGFFLSGIVEVPSCLFAILLLVYLPRKIVSCSALLLQSAALFCAIFFGKPPVLSMVFPLLAKFFNNITWSSQPLLYSEGTPTSVRNVFCAVVSILGELGGFIAPYTKSLESYHKQAPSLLIGSLSIIAAVAVLALPETRGRPLPEDIDDFEPGPLFQKTRTTPEKNTCHL